jgi:DNA-binding transcriptional regulator LsrR (DeoR family)
MNISLIGNSALRIAIQRNLVSFPSQLPAFMKRPGDDTQQRIAHLYFARGWQIRNICARYGLSKAAVQRLISEWRMRAVAAGFIQDIHPEDLDLLIHLKEEAELSLPADGDGTRPQRVQLPPTTGHITFSQTSV